MSGHSGPRSCSTGTRRSMHLLSLARSSISNLTANPWDPAWVSSSGHCKVVSRFHRTISRKSSGAQEDQYPDVSGITTCCPGSKHVIMFGRTTNILHNYDWIPVSTAKALSKITATTCTSLWGFRKSSWNFKFWEMHLSYNIQLIYNSEPLFHLAIRENIII